MKKQKIKCGKCIFFGDDKDVCRIRAPTIVFATTRKQPQFEGEMENLYTRTAYPTVYSESIACGEFENKQKGG